MADPDVIGGAKHPDCPQCGRTFASYQRRRLHQRNAHPDTFHEGLAVETLSRPKARWTGEEETLMADFELDHPGMRITEMANQIHAQVLRHRSVEAIRCRRRLTSYKRLVGVLAASPRRVTYQPQGRMGVASANQPIPENEDEDPGEADLEQRGSPHARREERIKEATEERIKSALGNAIKELSDRLGIPIPNSLRDVQAKLDAWVPGRAFKASRPPNRSGAAAAAENPTRLRRRRYAVFQTQWKYGRSRVVKKVLNGEDLLARPTSPEGTYAFWKELFSRPSPVDGRKPTPIQRVDAAVVAPVSEGEIAKAIADTSTSTAPGCDGRRLADLKAAGRVKLTWIANACLWLGCLPEEWMRGRTILLPKTTTLSSPGEFRPITITPIITRTIHRLLSKRLHTLAPLPGRQKGFKAEEGCAANIALLKAMVKQAQTKAENLYVAWIDFKKAFDSVGHPSLIAAMRRWGMPPSLAGYISQIYDRACTRIDGEGATTEIRRGVLQGNPLSPYLFNICLDWALSGLPKEVGVRFGSEFISYLAFADDVALCASTRCGLQAALDHLTEAGLGMGLEIGAPKCATLGLVAHKKGKTWAIDKSAFLVERKPLQALSPRDFYRCPGVRMGSDVGASPHYIHQSLCKKLERLQKAPAKPQQKLWALKAVLIPQFLYPLANMACSAGQLSRCDRSIRRFVRAALHLPNDVPLGYLHAETVEGGG